MKVTCVLLIGALLATGYAYPASKESKSSSSDPADDAEFIVVPLEHQRPSFYNRYPSSFDGFDGVLDTADFPHSPSSGYFPSINPFTWQFSSYLDDLMRRLRDRFSGSWNPFYGGGDFAPSGPGLWPVEIPDDSSDATKTNTTSTVKIIDGHKVVINDTYYTKNTEFGTSIYKVRVIDVKPLDGEDDGKASTEKPEIETGNRSGTDDAETPKESNDDDDDDSDKKEQPATDAPKRDTELEASDEDTTPADDNLNTINNDIDSSKKEEHSTTSGIESFESLESEPLDKLVTKSPIRESLERNILRTELDEDREDASSVDESQETFSPDEWKQYHDDRKRIMVSVDNRFPPTNQHQLDSNGFLPPGAIDLSNDIAINNMLADQSIPLHPDVEVFSPNRRRPAQQDPMQPFPVFPGFSQSFPGGNRFPAQYPNQFPQQFPQRPNGQFPVQTFPIFPQFGSQRPEQGQGQRPGGFGQPQVPVLMMSFPQPFPARFREVRP
ncbi:histone-lysine N-methyltransferase SETD1B-like [Malaya genurostris]|uniref:histone-lysine N-methyltransferase SETD1B-like n=1 Tax=Malaya genurostris TaxID=325434 RepID=UPI0026F3F007|nr:histone-lysine N-methyltransferase SETD1B-like [Malaya genurostris]